MTDGTRKKLTIPPWQVPYLEKHNIWKLFYEIARELVINQPEDHVTFMRYLLSNAVKNVYTPRVILIGSPRINLLGIAEEIVKETKQLLVTEEAVLEVLKKTRKQAPAKEFVAGIQAYIHMQTYEARQNGWLLVDCIKTKQEAEALLEIGMLPTHVLYLILPNNPKLTELLYCNVPEHWPEHRRNIFEVVEIFKKKIVEVYLHDFQFQDVVNQCTELIRIERIEDGPKQPRVLILGPRGSGRKTIARMLAAKLNIIHIDFEYLLCQAWISATPLGDELREAGDRVSLQSELLNKVLNQRLLDYECLKQGWVLTGFPFNERDFIYMDCLQTPPNRVIFLECDLNVCFERLVNRRINVYTGSVTKIDIDYDQITVKRLKLHPKDRNDIINAELQYFCSQYGAMRKYAGATANFVNADQPERWVFDNVTAIIMRDLPISSPRRPFCTLNKHIQGFTFS